MIIGSIKENLASEKRVSLTPESAKNIISLGLKVIIEKNYAEHLGLKDDEYKKNGGFVIVKPTPALLFENRLVSFINTPIGIIELLSSK